MITHEPRTIIQLLLLWSLLYNVHECCGCCCCRSSVSGSLTALSAVTLYDFIRPAYLKSKGHELNEKTCAILSRVLSQYFLNI